MIPEGTHKFVRPHLVGTDYMSSKVAQHRQREGLESLHGVGGGEAS
jgi:hypothetical protein